MGHSSGRQPSLHREYGPLHIGAAFMIERTWLTLRHEADGDTCNTTCGTGSRALASFMLARSLSFETGTLLHRTDPSEVRNTDMSGTRCPTPSFSVFQFGSGVAQPAL